MTKQQFKEASAKKPKVRRYSTDEETPVASALPDDSDERSIKKK